MLCIFHVYHERAISSAVDLMKPRNICDTLSWLGVKFDILILLPWFLIHQQYVCMLRILVCIFFAHNVSCHSY